MTRQILLSGVKPTHGLTLGNYIGAVLRWRELTETYRCFFAVVDLHAITVRQDPKELRTNTLNLYAMYLACELATDHSSLFVQSHVPEHSELGWLLTCQSTMGELSRMTQYKDKSQKSGKVIPAGLFAYPALMAADILLYDTAVVPVGEDQKQHVELTRDLAQRVNSQYGEGTLVVPEPLIGKVGARIMDLQKPENKMSKSDDTADKGTIYMMDEPKEIVKKFKKATTDSGDTITFSDDKPGIKNLLSIQMALTGRSAAELESHYAGKQYGHLKVETADIVVAALEPIQQRYRSYLADLGELERMMAKGAAEAQEKAAVTLSRYRQAIGLI